MLKEKVKVCLIHCQYIISGHSEKRDSVGVRKMAREHKRLGFESILVLLLKYKISYVKCFYKDIF